MRSKHNHESFLSGRKVQIRLIAGAIAIHFLWAQLRLIRSHLDRLTLSNQQFSNPEATVSSQETGFTNHVGEVVGVIKNTTLPKYIGSSDSERLSFPETRFTHHVREVVGVIENNTLRKNAIDQVGYWPEKYCSESVRIVVGEPFNAPSRIECNTLLHFCTFLKQVFASNTTILPYNISVGSHSADMSWKGLREWGICISSSAAKGSFTMTNFEDMINQNKKRSASKGNTNKHPLLWEERQPIPIFRGDPRIPFRNNKKWKENGCPNVTEMGHRMKAADFSFFHPHLLDAVVSFHNNKCNHFCCMQNQTQTNGIDRIFRLGSYNKENMPPSRIPSEKYYSKYQTVLVLGGIGAAFRTGRHLSAGQAIVLQDFKFEEWFVAYMDPFVHYIPLKEDLSDLKEVMEWVRDNPAEVKKIAEQGNKFYWDYLSFEQTDNHWHELLWRLSLSAHENGSNRLKYGKGRDIWPAPIMPHVFERGLDDGQWVAINTTQELAEEDVAL